MIAAIMPQLSTALQVEGRHTRLKPPAVNSRAQATLALGARFARLRHGINLSNWFARANNNDYSQAQLESHTTAEDTN